MTQAINQRNAQGLTGASFLGTGKDRDYSSKEDDGHIWGVGRRATASIWELAPYFTKCSMNPSLRFDAARGVDLDLEHDPSVLEETWKLHESWSMMEPCNSKCNELNGKSSTNVPP
jgi:hypothetical protein